MQAEPCSERTFSIVNITQPDSDFSDLATQCWHQFECPCHIVLDADVQPAKVLEERWLQRFKSALVVVGINQCLPLPSKNFLESKIGKFIRGVLPIISSDIHLFLLHLCTFENFNDAGTGALPHFDY